MVDTAFGIDFGTTNTRIAYFDGEKPIMIPVFDDRGREYSIPSVVGYINDEPVAFGHEALTRDDVVPVTSIKWELDRETPLDLGNGYDIYPIDIVTAFFRYIKDVVNQAELQERELKKAAITVPVKFPYRSRENLCKACENAGIEIVDIFQEPVAALYCHALCNQHADTAAVFDWGGGTLDVATVKIDDGRAQIQVQDGQKVGGDDFDRIIAMQGLIQFKKDYPDIPLSPEDILKHSRKGPEILRLAEAVKRRLSTPNRSRAPLSRIGFLPDCDIEFEVGREDFEEWVDPYIERGINCLLRTIKNTGVAKSLVNPVLLSGGTCNIPLVKERLQQEFGPDVIITNLPFDSRNDMWAPETDVSNATAIGAALLSVFGAEPIFSSDIGIRTAGSNGFEDAFYPIFKKNELLDFENPKQERFFVTNTQTGVARLLICDRLEQDMQPQGLLRRIVPIPIDKKETWIEVDFELTQHLGLRIHGSGQIARANREETEMFIHELNLGFNIPEDSRGLFNS